MSVKTLLSGWTVIKEISISQPPARIFNALTAPRQLDKWFTTGAKVNLRVGGRYSNHEGDKGKFLEIVPGRRLRYTWDNPSWAPRSVVEILLKRIKGKTVLTLIHSGIRKESEVRHYASKESGWNWALSNLKAFVEGRKMIGYEDFLSKLQ